MISDGRILLIRRAGGDYAGLWGLPGGKVEKEEHLSEAAVREIYEESGIRSSFKRFHGVVSELLVENGAVLQHFLLHVCELSPSTTQIERDTEGELTWFDLAALSNFKDKIIPSDYQIIDRMIMKHESLYYDCVLEKSGDRYNLKKFDRA